MLSSKGIKTVQLHASTAFALALIACKTASIATQLFLIFPFISPGHKDRLTRFWYSDYLSLLGVQAQIMNADTLPKTPFLLAANHISWLDFFALNLLRPMRVVAKEEIASWPLIGMMARRVGIIFANRSNIFKVKNTIGAMVEALKQDSICIFPEGTTHLGNELMPFKSALFASAVLANIPVYPLAIRYIQLKTGERTDAPAYMTGLSFFTSVLHILRNRPLKVILEVIEPAPLGLDRRGLANFCHLKIATRI